MSKQRISQLIRVAPLCLAASMLLAGSTPAAAAEGPYTVADPSEAITFARLTGPAGSTIGVAGFEDGAVIGVDLNRRLGPGDAIALLERHGAAAIRDAIASKGARRRYEPTRLGVPVGLTSHHVAAGTNFPAHADESGVEDGPFLFAKAVEPTPPQSDVSAGAGLLDFEVELAFVALERITEDSKSPRFGLIVSNDFTDRALLMRKLDVDNPTSGTGFTTGKSAPGYLPVGRFFVVPDDARAFAQRLELTLSVNGEVRQSSAASRMVWDIDEILAQTFARANVSWEHRGTQVGLLDESGAIPARTLIMTGTPDGTVFQGVDTATRVRGVVSWLAGGWDLPLVDRVIETYISRAQDARIYLQPGDRVTAGVTHLGTIESTIVD